MWYINAYTQGTNLITMSEPKTKSTKQSAEEMKAKLEEQAKADNETNVEQETDAQSTTENGVDMSNNKVEDVRYKTIGKTGGKAITFILKKIEKYDLTKKFGGSEDEPIYRYQLISDEDKAVCWLTHNQTLKFFEIPDTTRQSLASLYGGECVVSLFQDKDTLFDGRLANKDDVLVHNLRYTAPNTRELELAMTMKYAKMYGVTLKI